MSEGETKPTPFIKSFAHFLIGAANDKKRARELPEALKTAHTFNTEAKDYGGITAGLDPEMQGIFNQVMDQLDIVYKGKVGSGYVDFRKGGKSGVGMQRQTLLEEVGRLIRGNVHRNLRDVNAKRVAREIAEEIAKKNNW